jgi:hypothetical protein
MPDPSPLLKLNLGPLDAETDQNFQHYSVDHDLVAELAAAKLVLITAPKGYGKSALARLARVRLRDSILLINQSKGFDVEQLATKSSSEIRRKFSAFLIAFLIAHLESCGRLDKALSERILENKAFGTMRKVFGAVKIKPPFLEVALDDIFPRSKAKNVAELLSNETCGSLMRSIGNRNVFIVIDDSDSFASTSSDDEQKLFLRELIMAAHDVSHLWLPGKASVTVLLKEEVFKRIRNGFGEFDKIRAYWAQLKWNNDGLYKIAERRFRFAVQNNEAYKDWTEVFDSKKPRPVLEEVFDYSIHGPRNALELLNLATSSAAHKHKKSLGVEDIRDAVPQLAQEKLKDLASFYDAQYPDISDLIVYIFESFTMPVTRDELESRIRTRVLDNEDARQTFGDSKWAFRKTARRFIELLFEVGVIGFAHNGKLYFQQDEDKIPLSRNVIIDTHPALKLYLQSGVAG